MRYLAWADSRTYYWFNSLKELKEFEDSVGFPEHTTVYECREMPPKLELPEAISAYGAPFWPVMLSTYSREEIRDIIAYYKDKEEYDPPGSDPH